VVLEKYAIKFSVGEIQKPAESVDYELLAENMRRNLKGSLLSLIHHFSTRLFQTGLNVNIRKREYLNVFIHIHIWIKMNIAEL